MILSRWDRRESGGSNYDKCCFHVPKPWLVETLLNAFLQGATVQEKKRWADPYYLITITVLSLPSSFCEITLTFFALSSSSSFASGKSTFLPLPFFRTVDIVNARDSSTTAQVKKHSFSVDNPSYAVTRPFSSLVRLWRGGISFSPQRNEKHF